MLRKTIARLEHLAENCTQVRYYKIEVSISQRDSNTSLLVLIAKKRGG